MLARIDWEQRSINERIKYICDTYFKGNVKGMADAISVSRSTLRDVIGERGSEPSYSTIRSIVDNATMPVNPEWLITGVGADLQAEGEVNGLALYDVNGAAGHESFDTMLTKDKVIGKFVVPSFASAEWMIYVRGSSMHPKYSSGDIIACREIKESKFIQWNKVYVVATREQGLLIKRLMPSDDERCIKAVSENTDYPPFDIPKDEIFGLALVLGAIKLE